MSADNHRCIRTLGHTYANTYTYTDIQTYRHTDIQTNTYTDRQTDRQTGQTDRQTDRPTDRTDRHSKHRLKIQTHGLHTSSRLLPALQPSVKKAFDLLHSFVFTAFSKIHYAC